ncbi:MAG: hypothetical protein HY726_14970 [Candidatus Rokubacteria bacterium]|nr:hypothetical protein [Candidatus Rokubacteria bacterium]
MGSATLRHRPAAPGWVKPPALKTDLDGSPRASTKADQILSWSAASAAVAHELKNLLGATELYASLIEEAVREHPDLSLLASRLLTGIRSLTAVATNLLAFGRRPEPLLARVDLHRVLEEATTFADHAVRGTGVELVRDLAATRSCIRGDTEQLKQVFLNLLLNALQAMPHGGSLTIGTEAKGRRLRVKITDTGIGIAPELLARIFEPFVTTKPRGTGLGLAVVSGILTRHGATIKIASAPGQGTEVRCDFPLAPDDQPADEGGRDR